LRACQGENCSDNGKAVLVVVTQEENEEEAEKRDEMLINGPDHLALCLSLLFLLLQLLLPFYIE
jgi:hypothetical protein